MSCVFMKCIDQCCVVVAESVFSEYLPTVCAAVIQLKMIDKIDHTY